ncbi:MAG: T9SS type A sorting domain-containing protein [Bacteroidetes bacterium]|nr:T9SS type A sorting domain-containing protein [Bacteroidota bacterium]
MMMMLQGRYHDLKAGIVQNFVHGPAKKWYNKTICGLLFLLCLQANGVLAQGAVKYTVTYVAETKTVYKITDSAAAYSIAEQVSLLPEFTRDSIIKQVYTNNDVKTTIFHFIDNRYEAWQTKPYKTIIDKSRIKVYDASGALILNELHSVKYKNANSQLKSFLTTNSDDIIPDFVFLTTSMKTDFTSNGFVQTNLGGGTFKYEKDSLVVFFNNSKRLNEFQLYNTAGNLKYSVKKHSQLIHMLKLFPAAEVRIRPDTRFPESCVQEMQIIEYPYYRVIMAVPGKEGDMEEVIPVTLNIQPNPATENIVIEMPIMDGSKQIIIYDNAGRKIDVFTINENEMEFVVNIKHYENGIYYIQFICNETVRSGSFIKN